VWASAQTWTYRTMWAGNKEERIVRIRPGSLLPISLKDTLFLVNIDAQIKTIRVNRDHVLDWAIVVCKNVTRWRGLCSRNFKFLFTTQFLEDVNHSYFLCNSAHKIDVKVWCKNFSPKLLIIYDALALLRKLN